MITTNYVVCTNIIFELRGQNMMLTFNHKESIRCQCVGWWFSNHALELNKKSLIDIVFQQGNGYIYSIYVQVMIYVHYDIDEIQKNYENIQFRGHK